MHGLKKKYKVDYHGQKDFLKGAKEVYEAGETVRVCYRFIATDTVYSFLVDGAPVNPDFDTEEGYIITFTMPEHDVSMEIKTRNLMVSFEETQREQVLTFESFDGGGPSYEVKIADESIAACKQTHRYFNPNHEEMCGSGYEVNIAFTALRPGETTAVIACRSDIADNYDAVYGVTVDGDLNLSVILREQKPLCR